MWTLYAATYTTANVTETVVRAFSQKKDEVLVGSITFLSTCLVNVPLGVWKDIRFVQAYGNARLPNPVLRGKELPSPIVQPSSASLPRVPKVVGATFLIRDAITILGSFTLPSVLCEPIPDTVLSDPVIKAAAAQLVVPIFSQVFATPVHILGLDLYNHPQAQTRERLSRIRENLGPTTAMRCFRIIPAFGVGCIMNTNLRRYFHKAAGG